MAKPQQQEGGPGLLYQASYENTILLSQSSSPALDPEHKIPESTRRVVKIQFLSHIEYGGRECHPLTFQAYVGSGAPVRRLRRLPTCALIRERTGGLLLGSEAS